jgi:hypothetical protein
MIENEIGDRFPDIDIEGGFHAIPNAAAFGALSIQLMGRAALGMLPDPDPAAVAIEGRLRP